MARFSAADLRQVGVSEEELNENQKDENDAA